MGKMTRGIVGYSTGYIGQGVTYNFISTYFIVFMTDCIGMASSYASTIMSLALVAEVFVGMVVGNLSDNCTSKMGKRRPFILTSAICMPIVILLLIRNIEASESINFTYYLVMSILFRTFFACFEIPNNAFGAEIAKDYDERTILRTSSRLFGIIGNFSAYVLPLWILDLFDDVNKAWSAVGMLVASVCFIGWMGSFIITRPYSYPAEGEKVKQKGIIKNIVINYLQLAKLKTMKILIVYKAAFTCALNLFSIATVYFLKYSLGLSNTASSYFYIVTIIIFLTTAPVINKMALHMGKSRQQMYSLLVSGIIGIVVYFFLRNTIAGGLIYIVTFAICQNGFWQLSPSIFYDITEVDEFVNGSRREGDISSLVSVFGTLISAVVVQVFGILFDMSGYVAAAEVQPYSAVEFLNLIYILVPSVCLLIGSFALKTFPINKKTFESLQKAVELKRKGMDWSLYEEDVNKIVG